MFVCPSGHMAIRKARQGKKDNGKNTAKDVQTNSIPGTNAVAGTTPGTNTVAGAATGTNGVAPDKKSKEAAKPVEVVFVAKDDHAKMVPVKIGICDDSYWEIIEGLTEGQEIVSGGFKAISRDLADGKKIKRGTPDKGEAKEAK